MSLSSSFYTSSKGSYSHPLGMPTLTGLTLEALLLVALYAVHVPSTLSIFMIIMICIHQTSKYWMAAPTPPPEPCNVRVSISSSGQYAKIEIGGPQHSNDWEEDLQHYFAKALKTESIHYNSKHFRADISVHSQDISSSEELRNILDMLSPQERASFRTPHLEVNVEIHSVGESAEQLEVPRLLNLEKLTWKGSCPSFFLFRSEDEPALFPRLKELYLIDCDLSSGDLVEIFSQCPALTSCEVHQLPNHSKDVRSVGSSPQHHSSASPFTTPLNFSHMSLQNLKIASSLNLNGLFDNVKFENMQSISLHVSRSTPMSGALHHYLTMFRVPWSSMTSVELVAPLDTYTVYYLNAFFRREPALYSRTHLFRNDKM